jgi:hypothetical protein
LIGGAFLSLVRQSQLGLDEDPTAVNGPTASFCLAANGTVERLDRQ